jgi:hypothetical protein
VRVVFILPYELMAHVDSRVNVNPVHLLVPCFRRDDVWIPAGVYPHENGAGITT